MKPVVLMAPRLPKPLVERLSESYELLGPMETAEVERLPPGAERARALVTLGSLGASDALMAALPELGLILCYGTGFERVDTEAARARGIRVTNAGEANAEMVAEFAMGLTLAAARRIPEGDRHVRTGKWRGNAVERLPLVAGLLGRRMGIYGLGAIGKRVATRAAAFGMEIAYHNRRPAPDVPYAYHDSLESLARWSDVLMVTVRAAAGNRHSVNASILEALGPRGILVNVSRGLVIDEEALCEALEKETINAAALDVYEHEPHVPERLRALNNAVLTPHMGAFAEPSQVAQRKVVADNLAAFFGGGDLSSVVV